jgi:hypothetical protein
MLFAAQQLITAQTRHNISLAPDAEFTASSRKDDLLDTGVTWTATSLLCRIFLSILAGLCRVIATVISTAFCTSLPERMRTGVSIGGKVLSISASTVLLLL